MTLPVEGERKQGRTEGETRERAGGESRWEEKDERLGEERLVIATIILLLYNNCVRVEVNVIKD